MTDVMALGKERTQLFRDVFEGRIPKRVPVYGMLTYEFAAAYAGKGLVEAQYDQSLYEGIVDKCCQDFKCDNLPVVHLRFPALYRQLGAKNWVMGSNGFLQHPEVEGLKMDEYDDFIASPFDCIVEKVLPRLYTELDTDPGTRSMAFAKAFKTFMDEFANVGMTGAKLSQKYGYANVDLFAGACEAPFDFVADQLRGFKNILTDVRRVPDKVQAACEAVLPVMEKMGMFKFPTELGATFIPLHMAPFMRPKDFERLYWPTFLQLVEKFKELGQRSFLFVEQDWMRYIDYLQDMPAGTVMLFEYGDAQLAKDKLGDKHIISGFYPVTLLKTGTKQQCIDKAKEMIDIMAPGGNYCFAFDKAPLTLDSVNVDNLKAVYEYVTENATY
jgi:hypothetical protein